MKNFLPIVIFSCVVGLLAGGLKGVFRGLLYAVFVIAVLIILGVGFVAVYTIKESRESKKE